MNLTPLLYRLGGIAVIGLILVFGGVYWGKMSATKEYLPQITELRDKIDAADNATKLVAEQQKENKNVITKENEARIVSIRAYYQRMLQTHNQTGSSTFAPSSSGVDATGSEQTPSESSTGFCTSRQTNPEFEQACILDANKVTEWQHWAEKNNIPVEKE